ncbi:hypothetical protein IMSHALPRED_010357 [Imshaugia aleurites]|uniref:Uncharacterized protein n=1 Tax=Imshaugia aleurites TaxID=172621 RepID=A0A8H3G4U5_9LECA|nr:hypothetical protein IMSHALPRED_010357 [Imshaugia aleurites]
MHLKPLSALFLPFLLSSVLAAPAPKNHENANGALQARQEPEVYPPEGYANWGDYFETFDGDSEITPGAALKVRDCAAGDFSCIETEQIQAEDSPVTTGCGPGLHQPDCPCEASISAEECDAEQGDKSEEQAMADGEDTG